MATARPRLALPFAIIPGPDLVRLVAGEDHRYTLSGPGIAGWLPQLLAHLDGCRPVAELLSLVDAAVRPAAAELLERLYGERVLVDGPVLLAHRPARWTPAVEGSGVLRALCADALATLVTSAAKLPVLCQDRLDYAEVLRFNRSALGGQTPWLWVSCGPMTRGYVSPPFLPGGGPCLRCLLDHFHQLSPVPELYAALLAHSEGGGTIPAVPFPAPAAAMLVQLVRWKLELLAQPEPPAALYELHVLDVAALEITAHPVFPECPDCGTPL